MMTPAEEIARNLEKKMGWAEGRITWIDAKRAGETQVTFNIHCDPFCSKEESALLHGYLEEELAILAARTGIEAPKLVTN
jgi:hypothetical protein